MSVRVVGRPASPSNVKPMKLSTWAETLARTLVAESLPRRFAHLKGAAERARGLAPILGDNADLLEAAAWLHDIGYAPILVVTGFHPLDGARYLRDSENARDLLCRVVAHHSCAAFEAEERGVADELNREFAVPPAELADAMTFCDMTTTPDGKRTSADRRIAEVRSRYGADHVVTRSIDRSAPYLMEATRRITDRLAYLQFMYGRSASDR